MVFYHDIEKVIQLLSLINLGTVVVLYLPGFLCLGFMRHSIACFDGGTVLSSYPCIHFTHKEIKTTNSNCLASNHQPDIRLSEGTGLNPVSGFSV